MYIYAYKNGSASAKALAESLGIKRIKHEGAALKAAKVVINWGSSKIDRALPNLEKIFNKPEAVAIAANKLSTFKTLIRANVNIPSFTTKKEEAKQWLGKSEIVARSILTGHSGQGITIVGKEDQELPDAKLYTEYIPKRNEYRIHVFQDKAFFIQRKARKQEVPDEEVNWKVRNLAGGFIFAHKEVDVGEDAKKQAVKAVKALGLDFGAVDIVYNEKQQKYYVLEVNTACGLEGTTLEKYCEQFRGAL